MNARHPNWKAVTDTLRGRIAAHAQECPLCLPDDRGESLVSTECAGGLQLLSELLTAFNHRIAAGDPDHPLGRMIAPTPRVRLGDEQ